MPTIPILQFNKSMGADPRNVAQLCKHFDNFTKKHALTPLRDSEGVSTIGATTQALAQLKLFLMYGGNLYGLGVIDGQNRIKIYRNEDVSASTWVAQANAEDSSNGVNSGLFVQYKGTIWGDAGGTRLWSHVLSGNTFTSSAQALTYTSITQGLIHSKDDILYLGYTNTTATYIASKNGAGAWNITALTLPTNLEVVSICEYGNYLAIGCNSIEIGGSSKVFLWDRDSSVTTLSESLDVGVRVLAHIEVIDGYLIAITEPGNTVADLNPKITFLSLSGRDFILFNEILFSSNGGRIVGKQKINSRLYFGIGDTSLGATSVGGSSNDYVGVWSLGRNDDGTFTVGMTYLANNNTAPTGLHGFLLVGDYLWASFTVSSTVTLSKTNDQASYTATQVYRTSINQDMSSADKIKNKTLISAGLMYEQISGGVDCVLKYKVNGGSFITLFTETDTASRFTKFQISDEGYDIEFRSEERGFVITGLFYEYIVKTT